MNAFDQKIWAPNMKGYLSIDNKSGSRIMKVEGVKDLKVNQPQKSINIKLG